MPDINREYQKKHLQNISQNVKYILAQFDDAINEISLVASLVQYKGGVFSLDKYPLLKAKVTSIIKEMQATIYATVVNSIQTSWELSNDKNNIIADRLIFGTVPPIGDITKSGKPLSGDARQILYDPNKDALNAFLRRVQDGLGLSSRVWRTVRPFYNQLEQGLAVGISKGKPAAEMARDLKQYLKYPDKLFRRVRDEQGNLKLSKAAQNFHPGQGVYRSSYKNALRLTATETNIAYRTNDHLRWQNMPFVLGYQVHLSNAHHVCDVCDKLQGKYPKDFVFKGWHPHCICYATPVLMSGSQYSKFEDSILGIGKAPNVKGISKPPKAFDNFVENNRDTLVAHQPYWFQDNKQFV